MSFKIGLSGLNAAQQDLQVVSNNIANTNTVGFKSSRAEFADVYASSVAGGNSQVAGVQVADISQQFAQGSITNLPIMVQQQAPSGDQHFLFHRIYQQIDASGKNKELTDVLPAFPELLMPGNRELEQPLEPYGGQPFFSAGADTPAIMHLDKASYPDVAWPGTFSTNTSAGT